MEGLNDFLHVEEKYKHKDFDPNENILWRYHNNDEGIGFGFGEATIVESIKFSYGNPIQEKYGCGHDEEMNYFNKIFYGHGTSCGKGHDFHHNEGYNGDSGQKPIGNANPFNPLRYSTFCAIKSSKDLSSFNGNKVYYIDKIPTVITQLRGNIAKGFIINVDLTTEECYIVKVGNFFAHGNTIKKAFNDANNKNISYLASQERKNISTLSLKGKIETFLNKFKNVEKINANELYEWHGLLTNSCELGRRNFIKNNNIDLKNDSFTIDEFIELTKNEYGSDIIEKIKSYEQ